ncbi:hypothetical protein Avbf_10431 [Armadillidium vulgare]|nr:hypothetical protein Avbf_10431 [Armadillidium vulgare]
MCDRIGGSVLEGECYDYIPQLLNFEEAQDFCMERMGHIWTPNFNDIYLFDKIRLVLPKFTAAPKNAIWIGARTNNGVIMDVNGNDVTNDQFFRIENDDPTVIDGCAVYNFQTGAQTFNIDLCDDEPYHFICEYNVTKIIIEDDEQKPSLIFQKGPFVFLKKFHS